ncbi:MAG: alpha/beta hydrolase [Ruminococcus sp.]|nr:alpha/beta hydrolase [Ruminococcus sp.]
METWFLIGAASLIACICIAILIATIYFFIFTIYRKPTATLDNNIGANTDWYKHTDFISKCREWLNQQNREDVFIRSDDDLKLHATLIKNVSETKKTVICFHGYTSCSMNDYVAISKFYYENGFNLILVDERAHGQSDGKYVGFGVLDRMDALKWIDYAVKLFGKDSIIFLHGISMGAATVLMTSGLELPTNVKTIVADCGFTSAYDVFSHVLKRDYHIPKFPIMNLTDFLTKRFAGYGYKDVSTLDEVAKTKVPVIFIHGDKDDFVPVWMSEQNYNACTSDRQLVKIHGADHAEAYYVDKQTYENAILKFIDKYAK